MTINKHTALDVLIKNGDLHYFNIPFASELTDFEYFMKDEYTNMAKKIGRALLQAALSLSQSPAVPTIKVVFTDANVDPVPVHSAALHPTDTETTLELNVPLAEVVADITASMLQSSGYEVSVYRSCSASTSDSPNRASRIEVTIGWHVSDGQTNDDPVKKAMTETLTGGNNNKTISTDVFIGSVLA